MILGPALVIAAGAIAAFSIRGSDRADVRIRAGAGTTRGHSWRIPTRLPDPAWRWWPLLGAAAGWMLDGPVTAALGAAGVAVGAASMRRRSAAALSSTLDEQIADAVRSLAAGMRAGFSVPQAIAYAAEEGEPPLANVLRRVVDAVD